MYIHVRRHNRNGCRKKSQTLAISAWLNPSAAFITSFGIVKFSSYDFILYSNNLLISQECYTNSLTQRQVAAIRYKEGTYLEFSSAKGHDLAIKSLESRKSGIRLLNVRV